MIACISIGLLLPCVAAKGFLMTDYLGMMQEGLVFCGSAGLADFDMYETTETPAARMQSFVWPRNLRLLLAWLEDWEPGSLVLGGRGHDGY